MKIRLWTFTLPVSLTIFPGTPLEEMFGTSYRPLSGTEEGSFCPGYGQLAPNSDGHSAPNAESHSAAYADGYSAAYANGYSAPYADGYSAPYADGRSAPNADGHSATIHHWDLSPTDAVLPADTFEITSQYSNELYRAMTSYPSDQAQYGLDRTITVPSTSGEELLTTGRKRIKSADTENGSVIQPQGWSYGQHFESDAMPREHGHHFEPHELPMAHQTSFQLATNPLQNHYPLFNHAENPNVENFLHSDWLDVIHNSASNLVGFSPEFGSNQAISSGEAKTPEGIRTHEHLTPFQHSDHSTWEYYNQIDKFLQEDDSDVSHQFNSYPMGFISKYEAIQAHSKNHENIDFFKEMTNALKQSHQEQSTRSPEPMPPPKSFPFLQVIEFKPSSIDGEAMIEAINGLKLPDGRKFVNVLYENMDNEKQVINVKNPSRVKANDLCRKYRDLCRYARVQMPLAEGFSYTAKTLGQVLRDWRIFLNPEKQLGLRDEKKSKIIQYKTFVMNDIEQEQAFVKLREKIEEIFKEVQSERNKHLYFLERVKRAFPAFFFYVDLITTILPGEDLQNGALLRTTRKNAGKLLLGILEKNISQPEISKSDSELKDDSLEDIAVRKIFEKAGIPAGKEVAQATSFNWHLLYYWMLKTRKDLLDDRGSFEPQGNHFKSFFNDCFQSWIGSNDD